jgi:hypothetical protein
MNDIDLITLEYMSNNTYSHKQNSLNKNINKKVSKSDRKFYRKRIIHETKNMLKNEFKNDVLKHEFNNYIFSLVTYFKLVDKTDIIQKDYEDLNHNDSTDDSENENEKKDTPLDLLNLNIAEKKKITLDNFVKSNKPKQPSYIFPTQKDIDLKSPSLKEKGIKIKNREKKELSNDITEKELNEKSENNKEI